MKSGKDYERHNALRNVLECKEYGIKKAYVLCVGNIEKKDKVIYVPIYMAMFIAPPKKRSDIYKIDISAIK